jgi:hypothetical protein
VLAAVMLHAMFEQPPAVGVAIVVGVPAMLTLNVPAVVMVIVGVVARIGVRNGRVHELVFAPVA